MNTSANGGNQLLIFFSSSGLLGALGRQEGEERSIVPKIAAAPEGERQSP